MINTENYETKEFAPAPSVHASSPKSRLRVPKKSKLNLHQKPTQVEIHPHDLDFLSDFVKISAFYIEDLEDCIGEELMDFWQTREHAMRIITDVMVQREEAVAA